MRTVIPLLGGLVILALAGCGGDANSKPPQEVSVPVQVQTETQQANLKFALNMLQLLDESAEGKNLSFSPLSLSIALGMTLNGAANETYDAIARTLGYEQIRLDAFNQQGRQLVRLLNSTDPAVVIHTANGLWVDDGFEVKPDFLRTLLTFYESRVERVDFQKAEDAAEQINGWVKEETKGLIEQLFQPNDFNAETCLALINTLYFEGKWQYPFPKDATQEAPFHLESGATKSVPMMRLTETLPYYKGKGFEAVALPYGKGDYRFYLFLPEKGRSVSELRKQFTPENWVQWLAGFRPAYGSLQMPRFKVEGKYDLKPPLSALGMAIAFDRYRADFSGIADVAPERLYIQKAIQKAVIEVDEEGTKAAAATGITVGITSVPTEQFQIVADRPFLFAIVHQPTGTILFMGVVREP